MTTATTLLQELQGMDKDALVNALYNVRISEVVDYEPFDHDPHGKGKRIPYIGWFWRDIDVVGKRVRIGDAGGFVGVMENNMWSYPERAMTEAEVDTFVDYLERAFTESRRGGVVADAKAAAERVYGEMWDWFQTLRVEGE